MLLLLFLLVHFLQMILLDFLSQFAKHVVQLTKNNFLHFPQYLRPATNVGES